MYELRVPDKALLSEWLDKAGIPVETCEFCEALHLCELQEHAGVYDSRVFIEPYGLLFSMELELKNSATIYAAAELANLSLEIPTIKLFLEPMENGCLLLVASSVLLTGCGVSFDQFRHYLETCMNNSARLLQECDSLRFLLNRQEEASKAVKSPFLH